MTDLEYQIDWDDRDYELGIQMCRDGFPYPDEGTQAMQAGWSIQNELYEMLGGRSWEAQQKVV